MRYLRRMILTAAAVGGAGLVLLTWVVWTQAERILAESLSEAQMSLASSLAGRIDADIDRAMADLSLVAQLPEFREPALAAVEVPGLIGIPPEADPGRRAAADALLATKLFSVVFVLRPGGEFYLTHPFDNQRKLLRASLADRPYVQTVRETLKPTVSDAFIGASGLPGVAIDVPVFDAAGTLKAHLGGVIYLGAFSTWVANAVVRPFDAGFVLDRNGTLVGHTQPVQMGGAAGTLSRFPAVEPMLASWPTGRSSIAGALVDPSDGSAYETVLIRLRHGWTFGLMRRKADMTADIRRQTGLIAATSAALFLLLSGISIAMVGRIGQRWSKAERAVVELNATLEERVYDKTGDLEMELSLHRKTAAALGVSEARFRKLIETANVVAWELLLETWCFTYVSPQAEKVLGYPVDAWYAKNFWVDHIHPEDRAEAVKFCVSSTERCSDHEFVYRMLHADGRIVWVHDVVTVEAVDGRPVMLRGFMVDVTERMEAERALARSKAELERRVAERTAELVAANQELEAFAYSVSHDLRAPLRAIDGFSQALLEDYGDSLDEEARRYLGFLRKGSRDLDELVEGLLILSRSTRGSLDRQAIDLADVAREVADELRRRDPGREVAIEIGTGLDTDADPRLARVVLENLLGNAWKYTRGVPRPAIALTAVPANGTTTFVVRDNGVGFDMTYAGKLFLPFSRLHSAADFEGNGIGLATVKRIVTRHGGTIRGVSDPGAGAAFFFTLSSNSLGVAHE